MIQQRGFPLGMLFLLIAFCAVLVSLLTVVIKSVHEGGVGGEMATASAISAAILTALIGAIFGTHQFRRVQGGCLGSLAGMMLGAVVGPLAALNASQIWSAVTVCVGGSVLLIVIAAVIRWSSRSTQSLASPFTSSPFADNVVTAQVLGESESHEDSPDSRPSPRGWDS